MRVLFTDNEENCSQDKVLMEDREFEAGNILMAVPLDFQEMEEWRKAALYPWEKRPELILQNKGNCAYDAATAKKGVAGNGNLSGHIGNGQAFRRHFSRL